MSTSAHVLHRYLKIAAAFDKLKPKDQIDWLKRAINNVNDSKSFRYNSELAASCQYYLEALNAPGWKFEKGPGYGDLTVHAGLKTFEVVKKKDYEPNTPDFGKWLKEETNYVSVLTDALNTISNNLKKEQQLKKNKGALQPGRGTCPCCFSHPKLRMKAGKPIMVIHGYERPGYGYIDGRCHGHNFEPFELSKDGTVSWLKELHLMARRTDAVIDLLKKDLQKSSEGITKIELNHRLVAKPDGGYAQVSDVYTPSHPDWKKALQHREEKIQYDIAQTRARLVEISRDIVDLTSKVNTWEPHPERLDLSKL